MSRNSGLLLLVFVALHAGGSARKSARSSANAPSPGPCCGSQDVPLRQLYVLLEFCYRRQETIDFRSVGWTDGSGRERLNRVSQHQY